MIIEEGNQTTDVKLSKQKEEGSRRCCTEEGVGPRGSSQKALEERAGPEAVAEIYSMSRTYGTWE